MRKRVSKIASVFLLFVYLFLFSACRLSIEYNSQNKDENGDNEVKNTQNTMKNEKIEGKVDIYDKNSYYFVINNQKYTTESSVKDIEEAGFSQESNAAQTEIPKGSYSVRGGFFKEKESGNTVFSIIPANSTDETIKCTEASVGGFSLEEYYYKNYSGKIEIVEGITIGSSLDELVEAFGEPTEIDKRDNYENLGILYKYRAGLFQYFEFEIDKSTNKINTISWRCLQNQ